METLFSLPAKIIDFLAKLLKWDKMPSLDRIPLDEPFVPASPVVIAPTTASTSPVQPSVLPESITASSTPKTPADGQITPSQKLYNVAFGNIEKHLTMNTAVSPEIGCAQAVSWVLLNAGYDIPQGGISSVSGLTDWMIKQGFKEATGFTLGNIIVGRSPTEAHIGICGKEWIMSNTSYDVLSLGLHKGRFEANYHLNGWRKVFPSTRFFIPC